MAFIAAPVTADGCNTISEDFAVIAGLGHFGLGDAVMPNWGCAVECAYTPAECTDSGDAASALGETTFDIRTTVLFWRNHTVVVWNHRLGGY